MAQYKLVGTKPVKTGIPARVSGTAKLALTPEQQGYLGLRAKAMAPVTSTPFDSIYAKIAGSIQTPAQITAAANAQALAQERAQLAAQQAVSDQTTAQYNNQATRAQGFAAALAKLQSGEDDQAMSRYGEAADRLTGIGAGLTGAVGAGYQDAVDRAKAAVAQLTGGLGQTTAPDASAITNAAQYAGVTMPARTLEESAANAARMAGSDASARAQDLAHIGQNYTAQADQSIAQAGSDARALIAKRPATIADLVNQLTANRQTGISNLMSVLGARTTYQQNEQNRQDTLAAAAAKAKTDAANAAFDHWLSTQQLQTTRGYLDQAQIKTAADLTGIIPGTKTPTLAAIQQGFENTSKRAGLAAQWTSYNHFKSDWQGQPILDAAGRKQPVGGYKLDATGNVLKPTTTKASKAVPGGGGLTASGMSSLVKSTQKAIRDGLKSTPSGQLYEPTAPTDQQLKDANGKPTGFIADPNKPGKTAVMYPDALAQAIEAGPNTAAWRAKAIRLVNAVYKIGENGRPYPHAQGLRIALSNAKAAYAKAIPIEDALAKAKTMAAGTISDALIEQAFHAIYYGSSAFSPIPGSAHFQPTETSGG
jgi:hypothetical protein